MNNKTTILMASTVAAILTVTALTTVWTTQAFATLTGNGGDQYAGNGGIGGAGGAGGVGGNGGTNYYSYGGQANGGAANGGNGGSANGGNICNHVRGTTYSGEVCGSS